MSRYLWGALLAVSGAALAWGYAGSGQWPGAAIVVAVSLFWALGHRRAWRWASTGGLLLLVAAAAVGAGVGLESTGMLAGTVAALCAWILQGQAQRLAGAGQVLQSGRIERSSLVRLGLVAALGSGMAALALLARLQVGFFWLLLLALFAAIALGRALAALREER